MANLKKQQVKPVEKMTKAGSQPKVKLFDFAFGRENYIIMIIGLVIIATGYLFMLGGGSKDRNEFSYDLFSFSRITLSTILIVAGFLVEIYAIMKKPKTNSAQ